MDDGRGEVVDLSIDSDTPMAHGFGNHVAVACGDIFEETLARS